MEENKFQKPSKDEIIRVIDYIDSFVKNIRGGNSFWVAPNGEEFTTDVGYGVEFWEQVSDYLKRQEEMYIGNVIKRFKEQFPGLKIEDVRPYKDGLYFWIGGSQTNIFAKYNEETDSFSVQTTRDDWKIEQS